MAKFDFSSMPQLQLLTHEEIRAIHEEALDILEDTGVFFGDEEALEMFEKAGCSIQQKSKVVKFPRELVIKAIESAPSTFSLYNRDGEVVLNLGSGKTYYGMGPGCPAILADDGVSSRPGSVEDFKLALKIGENSPQIDIVSTAIVPSDIPADIRDLYILYLMLRDSKKVILGEAWGENVVPNIHKLLMAVQGSAAAIEEKPCVLMAVCPTPPLKYEHTVIQNARDCINFGIPIFLCPSPLIGVASPATLAGSVVSHTVELLAGLTFTQIYKPGAKVISAGCPALFDMRTTYPSVSALEAAMVSNGFALMAKFYGIPSLNFTGMSDSKVIDYQAGYESAVGSLVATLSGIDIVFGAGGLDSLLYTSTQKLALDSEFLQIPRRLQKGITVNEDTLAKKQISEVGHTGEFVSLMHTAKSFKKEHCLFKPIVDRLNAINWATEGKIGITQRADKHIESIKNFEGSQIDSERGKRLNEVLLQIAQDAQLEVPVLY